MGDVKKRKVYTLPKGDLLSDDIMSDKGGHKSFDQNMTTFWLRNNS